MAISGRLVLLALAGLLLTGLSRQAVLGYLAVLLIAASIDIALAARIKQLTLTRDASASVRLGERTDSVLRLANPGRRALRGRVRDAWVPSAVASPRAQPVLVPAGEQRRLVTELRPSRRGERTSAQVTIRAFGPMRLAARQRRIVVPGSVRVLPPFTSRRFLPEKMSRLRQLDGAVVVRQRGQGSEFDSLREYVIGDDVRAIDWRATARAHDVVVRTWRPERDRRVVLAVDTGRSSAARIGDAPRLDAAIDACLLLGALATRAGDRVALVAADVVVRARLGASTAGEALPKLVDALSPLESALVETDPQLLAGEVLRLSGKRSLVVLFTSLDVTDAGLVSSARALTLRHQLVVASVADPRLRQLAAARHDTADVYAAAAAELAIAERRAVAEQLIRLGVLVVDAPPGTFAAQVADAYLDLKAAGRL